jgi:hypothetical protein
MFFIVRLKLIIAISKVNSEMDLFFIRTHKKRHGVSKTAFHFFYRLINKLVTLKIFHCIVIKSNMANSNYSDSNNPFKLTILESNFWDKFKNLDEYKLNEEYLEKANGKNDLCFGFLDNGNIASYTWYAKDTSDMFDGELKIKFSDEYVLAHRTYTHPNYRGRRLHSLGIEQGLRLLSKNNYKGILGVVEANNFSSLKGISHFGNEEFGKFVCFKFRKKFRIFSFGLDKKYGLEILTS